MTDRNRAEGIAEDVRLMRGEADALAERIAELIRRAGFTA